jgi:cytochrome P450
MLPPGPAGKWIPTLKLIRNPRLTLERYRQKYGDPFLLNALNGPVVVTGREDLIRQIHSIEPDKFGLFALGTVGPILGRGSLFSMKGTEHRRERRMLSPMFQGEKLKSFGEEMCETARCGAEPHLADGTIAIQQFMFEISFRLIVRNIFGGDSGEETEQLVRLSQRMICGIHPLLFFSAKTHVKFLGLSPWDRFLKARHNLVTLLKRLIAARRRSADSHDDILARLCAARYEDGKSAGDDEICDELISFLFAGHETTALSLTWAMYHIHRHPDILDRLLEEIDSTTDGDTAALAGLPWLKCCINETLRLNPLVTETLRLVNEPVSLGEHVVPAGYGIAPATVLAHYNPQVWPEPDAFRPERFLDRDYSPFVYMPFGGGHRRCIGAAFAIQEMTMVLGTLLRHFRFELVSDREVISKRRNVTMGPSSPVPMRISRRVR